MRQAHAAYPFPSATNPPAWYRECRSGADFFIRPKDLAQLQTLHNVHKELWMRLNECLNAPLPALDTSAHHQALQAYKHHHRDNSPGISLLKQSFGETWTTRFLHECLLA